MKAFTPFLILITLLCTHLGYSQGDSSPVEYMSYFSDQYSKVAKDQWDYARAVARGKGARKIENKRQDLIKQTKEAEMTIKRSKAYNGDIALRDTLVNYLKLSYLILKEDYEKIMDMEEVAEQSYDAMEALILARENASDKMREAGKRMMAEQKRFAAANNIELRESSNELFDNLEKANEVFDYYNDIYLIFFKGNNQEAYLIEAMNKGDVNGMEQNKSALSAASNEGMTKLDDYKAYKGDRQLSLTCEKMLKFYQKEAEEQMPVIINFYVQKEAFERMSETIQSKKKKDLTQEEVDTYNKAAEDYNNSVSDFNATNEAMNAERSKLLDAWNAETQKFLDRHIPK